MRLFHLLRGVDGLMDVISAAPARCVERHTRDNQVNVVVVLIRVTHAMPLSGIGIKPHPGKKVPCDFGPFFVWQPFPRR